MARPRSRTPDLKRDKNNIAYVNHASIPSGRKRFGKWGEPETERRYREFLDLLAAENVPVVHQYAGDGRETVRQVANMWADWSLTHYRRGGDVSLERQNMVDAIREMTVDLGDVPIRTFKPRHLLAVRDAMARSGRLSRSTVNARLGRIKRFFKWACAHDLAAPDLWANLQTVSGLSVGEAGIGEADPVTPTPLESIKAAAENGPPVIADMLRVQFYCVMRPGEVCKMRADGVRQGDAGWLYVPGSHKTTWRGKKLVKAIPAIARAIVERRLESETGYLFDTAEGRRWGAEQAAETKGERKTKIRPSETKQREERRQGTHSGIYTPTSYRQAVKRACERAGVQPFTPNQVRHSAVTWVSETIADHDAAQLLAGHSHAATTEIYRDATTGRLLELASKVDAAAGSL